MIFYFILSYFMDGLFDVEFGSTVRMLCPLTFIFPFHNMVIALTTGSNKIKYHALYNIIFKTIFVLSLVVLYFIGRISVVILIIIYCITHILSVLYIYLMLKPSFQNMKNQFRMLWKKNKEYGIHLYLGQITDQSTTKLGGIFVSYFVNTTALGFFSLANILCMPMVTMSSAISLSLHKKFAFQQKIPNKLFFYNGLWLLFCLFVLVLFGKFLVVLIFSEAFLPTANLLLPLSLASLASGITLPHNSFLGAHGRGHELRNTSIIMSIISLFGNLLLVPSYGAMGAAWANFFSFTACSVTRFSYYRKYLKRNS
jgi:O-antigen/teichoic acid export membrane protein